MISYFCPYNLEETIGAAERTGDPSIVVEIDPQVIVHLANDDEAMLFALRFNQRPKQPNTFVAERSAELNQWLDAHGHSSEVYECTRVYVHTRASFDAFWAALSE